jgi:cold shock CspA family protein/ribosome-associated translation inhibitor RaiA
MEVPLAIAFRNMPPSPAVESHVRERAEALERFFGRIIACQVIVESTARRHRKGRLYHLHVTLTVPGRQIVVKRDPPEHRAHEDILVALRDTFDAAQRQLEDHARRRRGQTKVHEAPNHGRIVRLFRNEGYGFIRSSEGDEIYMHRNAVLGTGFEELSEGDEVRYIIHDGAKGPQASTVILIGKHHRAP